MIKKVVLCPLPGGQQVKEALLRGTPPQEATQRSWKQELPFGLILFLMVIAWLIWHSFN